MVYLPALGRFTDPFLLSPEGPLGDDIGEMADRVSAVPGASDS